MNHFKEKLSSLDNERTRLQKTNEKLIGRYGEQKTVVEKSVGNLVKSNGTRFVET